MTFGLTLSVVLFPADLRPLQSTQSHSSWRSEVTGHGLYKENYFSSPSLTPLLPPQAYLSLERQNGEDGEEENIVYL